MPFSKISTPLFCALLLATTASAQDLNGDNLILTGFIWQLGSATNFFDADYSAFRGSLCVGSSCAFSESFDTGLMPIKFKTQQPDILFEDVTVSTSSGGLRDWRIRINDNSNGGLERFSIRDEGPDWQTGSPVTPFTIEGGAPENAFWVAADGDIGLGTMMPQANLHIVGGSTTGLRMQNTGSSPYEWEMLSNHLNWFLRNETANSTPFVVRAGARNSSLFINDTSDIGMGTANPLTPLHIKRRSTSSATDFDAGILMEVTSTVAPRGLLTLRNEGQVFFTLEDTSILAGDNTGRAWNFQNFGGEFRVTTAPGGGADIEMRLDVDGNMRIEGNYFANSFTQMMVPDYVFESDYALRPLSEVASFVAEHKHLPEVPPASQIVAEGLNMTDMQMTLLKKVEELTLYVLELEAARAEHEKLIAQLRAAPNAAFETETFLNER